MKPKQTPMETQYIEPYNSQKELDDKCNRLLSPYEKEQYEKRIRAEAHADKLAEALRDALNGDCENWEDKAESALAEYQNARHGGLTAGGDQ